MKKFVIKILVNAVGLYVASLVVKSGISFVGTGTHRPRSCGKLLQIGRGLALSRALVSPIRVRARRKNGHFVRHRI